MKTVTATELKNHLGMYLAASAIEPVVINKSGREVGVMISKDRFDHLEEIEDMLWAIRAKIAETDGFASEQETMALLTR